MAELLKKISQLTEQGDREFADSVLEVSAQVNMQVLEELKGDDSVSEALLEIMQPLVEPIIEARLEPIIEARIEPIIEARMESQILLREEAAKRTGWEEGLEKGIQGMVDVLHDLGHEDAEIRQIIQKKYALSEEETAEYL